MIPGQRYNHDPRHFRFERQLQDHRGLSHNDPHFGDRFVGAACVIIAILAVAFIVQTCVL